MSDYMQYQQYVNGELAPLSPQEAAECSASEQQWTAELNTRLAREARKQRDNLLSLSDWAMLPDAPITTQRKEEFIAYRQALRDVPAQPNFPNIISWPTLP
jgi:hypothetical protein